MKRPLNPSANIWLHIAGIIVFLSMPILFSPDWTNSENLFQIRPFQREFFSYILLVCFFYISYLWFIPRLYFQKKYFVFCLLIIVCIAIIAFLPPWLFPRKPHIMQGAMPSSMPSKHRGFSFMFLGHSFVFALALLFLAFTLKMSNLWKQVKQEKSDAELSYLKAQINPHFLFNTLNSIYSLAIEKSDATASAIVKLSGMMRYVISETHMDYVSLQKEINYISDYIELQKLRISDSVNLTYTLTGNPVGKQIAPLLLIPFIENAFKFGVNPEKDSRIIIHLDIQETFLLLFVENNKVNTVTEKTGLGIPNTQSRLQLLYPGTHELNIDDKSDNFAVTLKIFFA
jgi:Na+-transporting methylmalonyl-CoA/oxaloacetate decarboxylase gamma subunit